MPTFPPSRRLRLLLLTLALLALPGVALAADASTKVYVSECNKAPGYKPALLPSITCNGAPSMKGLTWQSWTTTTAHGRGTFVYSAGGISSGLADYPASVVLTKGKACPKEKLPLFSELAVTFTGSRPAGFHRQMSFPLVCPYS